MIDRRALRLTAVIIGAAALVGTVGLPAAAKTSSPAKWGVAFCGGLSDWAEAVTEGGREIEALETQTSAAQGKDVIIAYMGDVSDATGAFYKRVKKAGRPDSTNGAKIQKAILKGIKGIDGRLGEMRSLADAIPTTDLTSFEASVRALASGFDTVSAPFDAAMTKVADLDKGDDLSGELQKVDECKALF